MHTILAALDGSPRARGVLDESIAMARAHDARLVLMRAVGLPADVPQDFWKATDKSLLEVLEGQAREYLAQSEGEIPVTIRGGAHVVIGTPWQAICRTAQTLHADLVIIGSHGYSGVDRLLGTTAAKVTNHCTCSVLVIKDGSTGHSAPPADPAAR